MSVALFPVKLIFMIAAVIIKAFACVASLAIRFVSTILHVISAIMCAFLGIGAIIGTIHMVYSIAHNSISLGDGALNIFTMWFSLLIWSILAEFGVTIANFINDMGDRVFDAAQDFMYY